MTWSRTLLFHVPVAEVGWIGRGNVDGLDYLVYDWLDYGHLVLTRVLVVRPLSIHLLGSTGLLEVFLRRRMYGRWFRLELWVSFIDWAGFLLHRSLICFGFKLGFALAHGYIPVHSLLQDHILDSLASLVVSSSQFLRIIE